MPINIFIDQKNMIEIMDFYYKNKQFWNFTKRFSEYLCSWNIYKKIYSILGILSHPMLLEGGSYEYKTNMKILKYWAFDSNNAFGSTVFVTSSQLSVVDIEVAISLPLLG